MYYIFTVFIFVLYLIENNQVLCRIICSFYISWILKYCKLTFIREQEIYYWLSIKMPHVSTAMQYDSKPSNLFRNISMLTWYSCQVLYYWNIFFSIIYIFLQGLYNTTCHFKLFTVYNLTYFLWYISILESLINKYIG